MKKPQHIQKTALAITRWIGSPLSIFVHTVLFVLGFSTVLLQIIQFDTLLLILNTIISLEAIYLALFNQLAINFANEGIEAVSKDLDEIQEDVGEIQGDIDEIQGDVDELQEDVEEISEDTAQDEVRDVAEAKHLQEIHEGLRKLMQDVEQLQKSKNS